MTIVAAIATEQGCWMGADSLASDADLRVDSSSPKVHRCANFLIGFAGSYGSGQLIIELLRQEKNLTLKGFVKNYAPPGSDWEILLADHSGVYEYQPGGGLVKMKTLQGCYFGVVGSGAGPAIASQYSWHDGRDALVSALRASEAHTNHVRRPFKVVAL